MGSYVFVWDKLGASNVFVTGDFDNWAKTVELNKEGNVFRKQVTLPAADKPIHYKFVVDGNWVIDDHSPTDKDSGGNTNNILTAKDLMPLATPAVADEMPGGFPAETPTAGMSSPPVPFFPGDEVPDYTAYYSTAQASAQPAAVSESQTRAKAPQESEQTFSVNPLPATAGVSNPIKVAPGEKLPATSEFTTNTVNSNVKLDEESYNRPDALPTSGGASANAIEAAQGAFGVAPVTSTLAPESAAPASGATAAAASSAGAGAILASSAGAGTTTAQLAGDVPLEPRGVPHVVEESQETAQVAPEASANPEAVADKEHVEQELKAKVPEEAPTSQDTVSDKAAAGVAAGTAALGAGAAAAVSLLPTSIQNAISGLNSASDSKTTAEKIEAGAAPPAQSASAVPAEVTESIAKAHASPEAAANPEAVAEKAAVEAQLQKTVAPTNEAADATPAASASLAATAPSATGPTIADESTIAAITMANTETPAEYKADATPAATGLNASAQQPAQTAATAYAEVTAKEKLAAQTARNAANDSRDVSPMSRPARPTVTTGAATGTTETKTTAESAETGAPLQAVTTAEDKKQKRRSLFGRIKDKITHKN